MFHQFSSASRPQDPTALQVARAERRAREKRAMKILNTCGGCFVGGFLLPIGGTATVTWVGNAAATQIVLNNHNYNKTSFVPNTDYNLASVMLGSALLAPVVIYSTWIAAACIVAKTRDAQVKSYVMDGAITFAVAALLAIGYPEGMLGAYIQGFRKPAQLQFAGEVGAIAVPLGAAFFVAAFIGCGLLVGIFKILEILARELLVCLLKYCDPAQRQAQIQAPPPAGAIAGPNIATAATQAATAEAPLESNFEIGTVGEQDPENPAQNWDDARRRLVVA